MLKVLKTVLELQKLKTKGWIKFEHKNGFSFSFEFWCNVGYI